MSVTLDGGDYAHVKGTLSAHINANSFHTAATTQLYWSLNIDAHNESEKEGRTLVGEQLRFYYDVFLLPKRARRWMDVTGQLLEWSSLSDFDEDTNPPALYQQWHHRVERGFIRFVERRENTFRVQWEGFAENDASFSIDTWVTFEDLQVYHQEGEDARRIVSRHLAIEDFIQQSSQLSDWGGITTQFAPKLA
ncbi:hypothetical protein EON83_26620 [bacterium]|nr:MAG: hypothetical protein EON83_26620 [bacterium]